MILNAYAVLAGFLCLLQLLIGLYLVAAAIRISRRWTATQSLEITEGHEQRSYLQLLLALLLLGFNLASWPLFYLLLQSYVPAWPRVMCIYGVTQIGSGSQGLSRHLPALLAVLQIAKPLLVFLGGSWFVVYVANRRTRTGSLMRRLLGWLLPLGAVSVFDSLCTAAYLGISKQEEKLSAGCCVAAFDDGSRFVPTAILEAGGRTWLAVAFFTILAGLCLALFFTIRRSRVSRATLAGLLAVTILAIPIGALFLVEIAAPTLLGRPHHCPYDLITEAPESVLTVVLYLIGCLSVGWAAVAGWFADVPETHEHLPSLIGRILFLGLFCFVGSLITLSLELLLA